MKFLIYTNKLNEDILDMLKMFIKILLLYLLFTITGCKEDDNEPPALDATTVNNTSNSTNTEDTIPVEPFMSKWWYSSPRFTSDLYFKSNGEFRHSIPSFTNYSTGRWRWLDEKNGIIQIDNWIHQINNDTNTVYMKTIRSTSNSMYVQQSIYSSTIFNGSLYLYKDSK